MRCPCCGREVASNERCCSNCGENNEYYTIYRIKTRIKCFKFQNGISNNNIAHSGRATFYGRFQKKLKSVSADGFYKYQKRSKKYGV